MCCVMPPASVEAVSYTHLDVYKRQIIARADSALVRGVPAADLRFGHDGNLMPLTCLMAFDGLSLIHIS